MKDRTKRNILIIAGLAISAVLVALIAGQMRPEPIEDVEPAPTSSSAVEIQPEMPDISEEQPTSSSAVSSELDGDDEGVEQTIQSEPEKPDHTEEELSNPDETPDGEPVEEDPQPTPPPAEPTPPPAEPQQPSGGGLPGFGDVPDGGENQQTTVDGDGDINTQVGNM